MNSINPIKQECKCKSETLGHILLDPAQYLTQPTNVTPPILVMHDLEECTQDMYTYMSMQHLTVMHTKRITKV